MTPGLHGRRADTLCGFVKLHCEQSKPARAEWHARKHSWRVLCFMLLLEQKQETHFLNTVGPLHGRTPTVST